MKTDRFFDNSARAAAETLIELAIAEDLGPSGTDVTSEATIPEYARGAARFVARPPGVAAGLPVLEMVASRFGLAFTPLVVDGDEYPSGKALGHVAGPMRALLAMERTALNFVQRLAGVATLSSQYVKMTAGTRSVILDTRKTTPGWRALEKYAVRCGGGTNHRHGLYDAVLIKDNHIAWLESLGEPDPVVAAVRACRSSAPAGLTVEVEVDTLDQFDRALGCDPDVILIDNLGPDALAEAVRRRDARAPGVLLEASGGVNLLTVRDLAMTGVDRISVGALTHSAPALDIGLDFERSPHS